MIVFCSEEAHIGTVKRKEKKQKMNFSRQMFYAFSVYAFACLTQAFYLIKETYPMFILISHQLKRQVLFKLNISIKRKKIHICES